MFLEMRWYGLSVWNLRRLYSTEEALNNLMECDVQEMRWNGNMVLVIGI